MSEIEYNYLVFKVSERLEELTVRDQVLFMCRRKFASGREGNTHNVLSLFQELEERNFLGIDRLEVMKDLLRSFEEWDLLKKVERLESARKEYIGLLEQIVRALDEVSDLERLIAVCREKIPDATEGNVRDVRTLFRKLENHNCLGIDYLGILKEILTELGKEDQLKEVEEFEKRRCEAVESQKRNAQVAAVVSSVRAAGERMIGAVSIHCTFRNISGALLIVGTGLVLRRCSSLEQFVEAFGKAILPAANALRTISEGSVCFTVQAENSSALEALWQRYRDGTLQRDLQKFLVTDEIKQLAEGGEVTLGVYIDEQEYNKSLSDLKNVEQGPVSLEMKQSRFLGPQRLALVNSYLEKAEEVHRMTTETEEWNSDSGISRTQPPSELGTEETSDATSPVFLKDLNKRTTAELSFRLQNDEVAMRRFGQAFGLDDVPMISAVQVIDELFPDTPVQLLKNVCKALQLHDLEDLLEKVKPCTLRLALSPKEIEKLPNADNRPTNFYGRAEVLIIHGEETTAHDTKEKFESFFRQFDFLAGSQVTTVKSNLEQLVELGASIDLSRAAREQGTVFLGESRIVTESMQLSPEERRKELAKELKQKEEELQKEMDKFEIAVSAVVNRWTRIEDMKSTLFIVYEDLMTEELFISIHTQGRLSQFQKRTHNILDKTLARIPDYTKVLLVRHLPRWRVQQMSDASERIKAISQALLVEWQTTAIVDNEFLTTMLEILHKRWDTLDIIAIMQEVKRTLPIKNISQPELIRSPRWGRDDVVLLYDSLTCLPRLKKEDENDPFKGHLKAVS